MDKMLGPHAIGIKGLALPDAITLARETGFDAITVDIREAAALAESHGVDHVRQLFADGGVRFGNWGVPVVYRGDTFADDLANLPALAALARDLGCPRATSGIMPGSDERDYDENWAFHVDRLGQIARVLADADCRLGIEFIGPKTFRAPFKHEFIYDLDGVMAIAKEIGTGNVGVLLDAWHLYTAGGAIADIAGLRAEDVIVVHVNDAPVGVPRDELIDNQRALPMETGVLDLVGFMQALRAIGCDAPVMPEPFSQRIDTLAASDPTAAARETARSMAELWSAAGLD